MNEFTVRLRELHGRYKQLESENHELSSMSKFAAELEAMLAKRDHLNKICTQLDEDIRNKEEYQTILKKQNEEF